MRLLKFKFLFNGEWRYVVFPDGLADMSNALLQVLAKDEDLKTSSPWLQFTGLVDKDGNEIYEGDIVEWVEGGHHCNRREVKWRSDYSWCGWNVLSPRSRNTGDKINRLVVVGNVYQNPELLKK